MGQIGIGSPRQSLPVHSLPARKLPGLFVAEAMVILFSLPALGQQAAGSASAGHAGTAGGSMTRSVAGPPGGTRPSSTRPVGASVRSGQSHQMIRSNNVSGARPQSTWERPKNPPPQWATPKNPTPQWATPYSSRQPNQTSGNGYRHRPGYRRHLPAYGVGYVGIPYYGYGDSTAFFDGDTGDDTAQQSQPNGPARPDYAPEDPCGEAGCPPDGPFYPPQDGSRPPDGFRPQEPQQQPSAVDIAAAQSNGLDHPEVTLVFNDGRPPKKVRSYVLTSSAVFVSENGHQTEIPIADLDMQATVAQNREAGVDFTLPGGSR